MAETLDLFAEVAAMRDELEEQGTMIDALVRTSGSSFRDQVMAVMTDDPTLAEVYRLVDGQRTQAEILETLRSRGMKGASSRGISERMAKLHDLDLIMLVDRRAGGAKVYRRTRLDRALGISRALGKAAT
jgi:hypothetical protein